MGRATGVIFGLVFAVLAVCYFPWWMLVIMGIPVGALALLVICMLVMGLVGYIKRGGEPLKRSETTIRPEDLMMTKAGRESFQGKYERKPDEPPHPVEIWLWRHFGD
jgi:hypothetical protein